MDYKNGYSLYIGIPFCPTTCLYCSFTSYSLAAYQSKVQPGAVNVYILPETFRRGGRQADSGVFCNTAVFL